MIPHAPFLALALKDYRPDLFQWLKSCTAQVLPAAIVKSGVRRLLTGLEA